MSTLYVVPVITSSVAHLNGNRNNDVIPKIMYNTVKEIRTMGIQPGDDAIPGVNLKTEYIHHGRNPGDVVGYWTANVPTYREMESIDDTGVDYARLRDTNSGLEVYMAHRDISRGFMDPNKDMTISPVNGLMVGHFIFVKKGTVLTLFPATKE